MDERRLASRPASCDPPDTNEGSGKRHVAGAILVRLLPQSPPTDFGGKFARFRWTWEASEV